MVGRQIKGIMKTKNEEPPKLLKLYTHGRWIYLFLALVALLIIFPFVKESGIRQAHYILYFLNLVVVLAIIYEVSYNLFQFLLALLIAVPILVIGWLPETPALDFAHTVLNTLLYAYAIFMILSVLMPLETVDIEAIYGTISLYILIGLCWANVYKVIDYFNPGAFVFSNQTIDRAFDWVDYLYYSFVTLTTLGYGDIVPVAPQARSSAILESISGVIFIAVMVSKTIGLYVSEIRSRKAARKG